MHTLSLNAKITQKDPVLKLDLKNVVPDGDYHVLVVLEAAGQLSKKPLRFRTSDINITAASTFGRDEIYGDNGR